MLLSKKWNVIVIRGWELTTAKQACRLLSFYRTKDYYANLLQLYNITK